jgi:indole-3-glycerol phosphate synthase
VRWRKESPEGLAPADGGRSRRVAPILQSIVDRRRERLRDALERTDGVPVPRDGEPRTAVDNAFLKALTERRGRAVIAEVKMGSPRLGSLEGKLDPEEQACLYARRGASALSVVVEPDFFHGSYDLLATCRNLSGLPAIAKDFVVDPLQLWWAKRAGADAVLLIASLYGREDLVRYARMARGLGLVPLIETHDRADLELLADEPWELVGVNNRDLRTFEVDLEHSLSLLPELPAGAVKVAESGIPDGATVTRLSAAGFDAFLVGEALLTADDPGARLAEMVGEP